MHKPEDNDNSNLNGNHTAMRRSIAKKTKMIQEIVNVKQYAAME